MAFLKSQILAYETFGDALEGVAADQPTAFALHVPGRSSLTYGDLGAQIRYARKRLGGWDLAPGDIVAGVLPSRAEMAVACATLPSSCTFAPLGADLTSDGYAEILVRTGARAVLAPQRQEHPIRAAARQHGVAEIDVVSEPDAPAGLFTLNLRQKRDSLCATPAAHPGLAYILASAGTTGRPKLVPSTHRQTLLYAEAARDWFAYSPHDVACHLTPIHLGNGLWSGLINPLLAGLSIVCLPESDIDAFFATIEEFGPTCLNANFTLLRAILRRAPEYREALRHSRFRFVRSASGRLHPDEIGRLEDVLGAPLLVGFSSIETAAISNDPLPPGRRKRGAAGLPLVNEVAVMDWAGRISTRDASGEIVVRGALVFPGYLNDPELTVASFEGDWFRTGDLGSIDEEGYVYVSGRIKEIINRGGEKISPVEIDAVIESMPGVKEAATFGIAHSSLGEEVVAALVRHPNAVLDEARVIEHVRGRVGPRKTPRKIYFVDRLPRTGNGKVIRRELPGQLGLDKGDSAAGVGSGATAEDVALSPLEGALAGLWASVLKVGGVGRDDNFFLLGGDSLHGAQVIAHVRSLFDVEMPMQALFGEAATIAGMARMIEKIRKGNASIEKDVSAGTGRSAFAPIPRRQSRAPVVLSHAQWRAWFLARLDKSSVAYNESRAHRLTGPVDIEALRGSLQVLLERHEILRTTFVAIGDEPQQMVHEHAAVDFECVDLSAAPAASRDEALSNLLVQVAQEPFNLESGPLARFRLVRLGDDEHVLLRVWHHIISDGWSAGIFVRELSIAYNALTAGCAVELPALALQYADYAVWERQCLSGEVLDRQLSYWKDKLASLPALDLPTDHARPAAQSGRGESFEVTLPHALGEALKTLGRAEGTTLFMTLLAAFEVLLHRHSGSEDIAVGTPIAGRPRAELEELIGFFANVLVLRVNLAGEPTFRELLARVRESALSAYTHQDVPFEKLVEELAPQRDLSRNPLFQVSFVLQSTPVASLTLAGLQASRLTVPNRNAKFDLTLLLREEQHGISASWQYSTDLFERATIERMATHFEVLLESIVAEPDQRIGRLALLGPAERRRVLVEWNDTKIDYAENSCVHELFEAQVERSPDAVAVDSNGRHWSYRKLNDRANRLAHHLIGLKIGPGSLVGIALHRSPEMIVSLLATLKAGAAYVPIPPEYPRARLEQMLSDAAPAVVLSTVALQTRLPETAAILCEDAAEIEAALSRAPTRNPTNADRTSALSAEQPAYVIFTSGSTGTPKGVVIRHRELSNYLSWTRRLYEPDRGVGAPVSTPLAFDATVTSLYLPLIVGQRLILLPEERQIEGLAELLSGGSELTLVKLTPTHLKILADVLGPKVSAIRARLFVVGGEAFPCEVAAYWKRHAPQLRIVNEYGPTESTVGCSVYEVRSAAEIAEGVSIGRPVPNTQLYILDRHLEPVPIGVPGELYIGGVQVGAGYYRRVELTADRFITDPFGQPGTRLYRSGDLCRFRPDGNIEFLGRVDDQVKIRGFRIELNEIETALAQQTAVNVAVVANREGADGEKRLLAYVVLRAGQSADAAELRSFLKQRLPDYMLPSQFVFVEKLPMLPTGKVDRHALPPPASSGRQAEAFVKPRNEQEFQLVKIWEELLGIAAIGIRDDFFELGGNSLLAVRLMGSIEQVYGKKLAVSTLFAGTTVEHLASAISTQPKDQTPSVLVKVQPHGSRTPFFFLHGDYNGGGVYSLKLARHLGEEQPFYALQPLGLSGQRLPATIESMAERYLETLLAAQPHGPYVVGGYCYSGLAAFEMARRLRARGEAVHVILIDAAAKNLDYRLHHTLVAWTGRLVKLDAEQQLDWFFRLQLFTKRCHELSGLRRVRFVLRRAGRLKAAAKLLWRTFLRTPLDNPVFARPEPAPPTNNATDWERSRLNREAHYDRVITGYVPHRYGGRITLIRAADRQNQTNDPTLGWSQVAREVDLHVVPGDHATCVTKFLDVVAAHVKSSMDNFNGG